MCLSLIHNSFPLFQFYPHPSSLNTFPFISFALFWNTLSQFSVVYVHEFRVICLNRSSAIFLNKTDSSSPRIHQILITLQLMVETTWLLSCSPIRSGILAVVIQYIDAVHTISATMIVYGQQHCDVIKYCFSADNCSFWIF